MQSEKEIITKVTAEIKAQFEGEGTGHDWWHIVRVVNTAKQIAKEEGANSFIVELSSLLHDVGDHKFHKEKDAAEKLISEMLDNAGVSEKLKNQVLEIVNNVSYKGANVETRPTSLEGKVVQDADRLDAIGAIGIARAFAFGGNKERLLYHPNQPPVLHDNFNAYKNDKGHTINHFYEKLLLLKDRMQKKSGKEMAEERHQYMEGYLKQFYKEWNWK